MALNLFGVDADAVRRHCFPHIDSFSATTAPTDTTVTEKINEKAARVAALLLNANVTASAIASPSPAWYQCANITKLMVALEAAQSMTGANPKLLETWQATVDAWEKSLNKNGAAALGDPALLSTDSQAFGPRTFATHFGLAETDASEASPIVFPIRMSDDL